MDFTSRKLVRRARIRRNHERQVRVAAVKSRKRPLLSSDPLAEQAIDQEELDGFSNSTYSTQTNATATTTVPAITTTVPSLPSLSGSLSLTTASTTSKRNRSITINKNGISLQQAPPAAQPSAATCTAGTPYPEQVKGGALVDALGRKPRQRRAGGTRRPGDHFDECVSDSNVPTEASRRRKGHSHRTFEDKYSHSSGHCSDSTVTMSTQHHHHNQSQEADINDLLGVQPRVYRKHGRVRPQGADAKRKRARQLERQKTYGSMIESVLEEEVVSGYDKEQRKDVNTFAVVSGVDDKIKLQKQQQLASHLRAGGGEKKEQQQQHDHHQPIIANVFPSNPPSPTLSRMVRQKTEGLNISETTLQHIKEMSSHLRIVNWLWDSTQLPLQAAGRKAKSLRAASPSAATTVTSIANSDNLVVVRRGAGSNWFDWPRENPEEACRQEQQSPISINSEFKSDYEDELMSLV